MAFTEDDEQFDIDHLHEFNQALARAGGRAIMPEDWAAAGETAVAMSERDGVEFPWDNNPIAQRMAAHMFSRHLKAWDAAGERTIDTRWYRDYDDSKPEKMTGLWVLIYDDDDAFPLADVQQYKRVAETLLEHVDDCQAEIFIGCDERPAVKFLAVKRGEYLCLFRICLPCSKALAKLTVNSPDYTGPPEWVDDRTWQPTWDPWQTKNPWTDDYSDWQPPPRPSDEDPWSQ
ncbi:hypothetical protein ABQE58_24990 [Mycolicibacterium elephantis]